MVFSPAGLDTSQVDGRLGVPSPGPAVCSCQDTGRPASSVPRQMARRTAGGFLPVSVDIVGLRLGRKLSDFNTQVTCRIL